MPTDERHARGEGYLHENYRLFHLRDTAGQERDFHFHEFDKLVILLDGHVEYAVENASYELRPWDILLVRHHAIHKAVIDRSVPYERVILYLNEGFPEKAAPDAQLTSCFALADKLGRHRIVPTDEERIRIRELISSLESENADEGFAAQTLRDTLLVQFLIAVNRIALHSLSGEQVAPARYDEKIARVLAFIDEDPTRELTVEELAERAFLSRYHFMRLFKAQTGDTVHSYIRQKRLLIAARLIRGGMPAVKAAEECGFSDYSAFYRAFRSTLGASPSQIK